MTTIRPEMASPTTLSKHQIALLRHSAPIPQQCHDSKLGPSNATFSEWSLEPVALEKAPPYVALSYVWGDSIAPKPLKVNGKEVHVTANLQTAIPFVQEKLAASEALWVDRLCIDQDNEVEKSHQVARMRDIYANAVRVIAWLGSAEDGLDSELAINWLEYFGSRAITLGIGNTKARYLGRLLSHGSSRMIFTVHGAEADVVQLADFVSELRQSLDSQKNPGYGRLVLALDGFLARPYWERIWVVQEASAACRVEFLCGNRSIDSESLHRGARLIRNFRRWQLLTKTEPTANQAGSHMLPVQAYKAVDFFKAITGSGDLGYVLSKLRSYQSKDPRDRVYALLGVAVDSARFCPAPDYTKTCAQVYTELARTFLQHGYFEILGFCTNPSESLIPLQSWVPDWSRPQTFWPIQGAGLDWKDRVSARVESTPCRSFLIPDFRASGALQQPEIELPDYSQCNAPLRLSIVKVCTVVATGKAWEPNGHCEWLQSLEALAEITQAKFETRREREHAIWQTAVSEHELLFTEAQDRMSANLAKHLHATFSGRPMGSIDAETFMREGLGLYAEVMARCAAGRRPLLTETGRLAVGPASTLLGDQVVIILGAQAPYILRHHPNGYTIVGDAYVHGCMDGECVDASSVVEQITLF